MKFELSSDFSLTRLLLQNLEEDLKGVHALWPVADRVSAEYLNSPDGVFKLGFAYHQGEQILREASFEILDSAQVDGRNFIQVRVHLMPAGRPPVWVKMIRCDNSELWQKEVARSLTRVLVIYLIHDQAPQNDAVWTVMRIMAHEEGKAL